MSVKISGMTPAPAVAGATKVEISQAGTTYSATLDQINALSFPASSTDKAVTRFNGTTGKLVQNSQVVIDDSGNMSGIHNITTNGGNSTVLVDVVDCTPDTALSIAPLAGNASSVVFGKGVHLNSGSNQLVWGSVSPITMSASPAASPVVYTLPDVGASTTFAMCAGNQTLAGTKTFSTGAKFATTGGTAATLDYYEVANLTLHFTGAFTASVPAIFTRIGKLVTVSLFSVIDTATASDYLTTTAGDIPSRFALSSAYSSVDGVVFLDQGVDATSYTLCGLSAYTSGGNTYIYAGVSAQFNYFTGSGTAGFYATTMSWITD